MAAQPADPVILKLATAAITTRDATDTMLVAHLLTGGKSAKSDTPKHIGIVTNFGADEAVHVNFSQAVEVLKKHDYELVDVTAPFSDNPDMQHIDDSRLNVSNLFKGIDLMILPTLATAVPNARDVGSDPQALSPQNTFFANYYGLPAVSVPSVFDTHGLPLGLQVVGKPDEDAVVLQFARMYQQAAVSNTRRPDL